MTNPQIIVALDYASARDALGMVDRLSPELCAVKVGKELFTAEGPALVRELVKRRFPVFLDLKFHDIPTTVAKAVAVAADLGVWMVNVHASGGRAMMMAAHRALAPYGKDKPLLIAVTVLTSLAEPELHEVGVMRALPEQVSSLAALAHECGLDGVVCSAQEAQRLRHEHGSTFALVTPGIRLAGAAQDDQTRIVTPRDAIRLGANYLVIGRPVTQAADPVQTLRTILEEISYSQS